MYGEGVMEGNFAALNRSYAEHGTTSYLPTTSTLGLDRIHFANDRPTDYPGAHVLGFHMEGPFLSKEFKGGMLEQYLRKPDLTVFHSFHNVRLITVAPEIEGAMDFIRTASKETLVSIGHTAADYDTALAALDAGASGLTHTYNAMQPFLKRAPGPIGAAIMRNAYCQMITDGFHIQQPVVLAAYRMFGPGRMVLISDSTEEAGLPDGEYHNREKTKIVRDGKIRLPNGTISGCWHCLFDNMKTCIRFGIPFEDAVRMASQTPAEYLGIRKGRIAPGYDADLLVLDDALNLRATMLSGEIFCEKN